MPTDLKVFWRNVHASQTHAYLTGSKPEDVYAQHGIWDEVAGAPKTFLEVGVGEGQSLRFLAARKHRVLAVDLVEEAFTPLQKTLCETWLTPQLPTLPSNQVDVALAHLVFQHCDDAMVEFLLQETVRALKPTGFLSFQYAFRYPETLLPPWLQDGEDNGVLFWRSKTEMLDMIELAGAEVLAMSRPLEIENESAIGWQIMRVRRRA